MGFLILWVTTNDGYTKALVGITSCVVGNGFASSRIISLASLTTKVMNEAFVSCNHPH
jgi:hypothetical protein